MDVEFKYRNISDFKMPIISMLALSFTAFVTAKDIYGNFGKYKCLYKNINDMLKHFYG